MLHIASLLLYFTTVWTISTGNTAVLLFPQNALFQVCFGIQFTLGVSVPVAMGKRGGIVFTSGFQFNYALPWNLSQFEPAIIPAREIGTFDLQDVYTAVEGLLDNVGTPQVLVWNTAGVVSLTRTAYRIFIRTDFGGHTLAGNSPARTAYKPSHTWRHGWQGGGACLLRTICELAETPLLPLGTTTEHEPDILEEIIHLLLTPSEDLPEAVNSSHRSANKLYQEAERLGRSGVDCIVTYPDCIESPLESFTEIVFP